MHVATKDNDVVQLDRIQAETMRVPIIGTTPLITHRFSEKAKRMMLDNMQGRKTPKAPKDPAAEYEAAQYHTKDGRLGIPAVSFKAATVAGARFYRGLTMVALRSCLFVNGEVAPDGQILVVIDGEPRMREDVVKVGRSGADLRYRPEFMEWSAELDVTYVTSAITRASVLSLIDAGGMGCGVGEWRPEKGGMNGCYRIDTTKEIEVLS